MRKCKAYLTYVSLRIMFNLLRILPKKSELKNKNVIRVKNRPIVKTNNSETRNVMRQRTLKRILKAKNKQIKEYYFKRKDMYLKGSCRFNALLGRGGTTILKDIVV